MVSCFSDSFAHKTTQQSDGSCNFTSDSQRLCKVFKKQPFQFCNYIQKIYCEQNYCNARHDDKMCFQPNCRYHIILIGNNKEFLKKLDAFCFNQQHLDWVYTLLKYRFGCKIVAKSGQLFDIVQRASYFNHQSRAVETERPSLRKRDS